MKIKNNVLSLLLLMTSVVVASCSPMKEDVRNSNLEKAVLARLDSISGIIKYMCISESYKIESDTLNAVITYYITDSVGKRTEYKVSVSTNDDCSEIFSWKEINAESINDAKKKNGDVKENGIGPNGSLIDTLIELRKR